MDTLPSYVVLLRGINVGGNKKVPMADLKTMMEKMGHKNVKTLLTSGNAIFDSVTTDIDALRHGLEKQFEKTFGFTSSMIIRPIPAIKTLITSDPFRSIVVQPETRLYVTFLGTKPTSTLKIPYETPEKDFRILRVTDGEVCSVLTVSDARKSTDSMNILEKEFGRNVTTRNWNTVMKMVAS